MFILYHYPNCSTCKKAKKWLDSHELAYQAIPIHEQPPTAEQLAQFWQRSGLPLKKFFNTSGQAYRERQLKTLLPTLSDQEQLELLASDGMLIKRPLLISEHFVTVGFKESDWEQLIFTQRS